MRAYELRRGWGKKIAGGNLRVVAPSAFGDAREEDGKVVASFGALSRLTAWTDGKALFVDTETDPSVPDDVKAKTISAFNRFLERATGHTAKDRTKRAQESAKAAKAEEA